jgi:hypothetical protein
VKQAGNGNHFLVLTEGKRDGWPPQRLSLKSATLVPEC